MDKKLISDHSRILLDWSAECSQCLGSTYDICRPYLEPDCRNLHPKVRFVIAQLGISCHFTSESSFLLLSNCKIWDADILLRSVLEGTLKFAYILQGTEQNQLRKIEEYWDILPRHAAITRHKRASALLKISGKENGPENRPIRELLLSEEELTHLSTAFPKKERQHLSRRWSFSEIARYFASHADERYRAMGCMAYAYGIQSHTLHQDGDGVAIIRDRCLRDEKRRNSIELAHSGRIISDICHYGFFRAYELLRACREDSKPILDLEKRHAQLFNSIQSTYQHWFEIEYGK